MAGKLFAALLTLGVTSFLVTSASASIKRPASHEQGNTYEECSVECDDFADAKGCRQFRQTRLICTEKKKSTWPIITAKVLDKVKY